MVIFHETEEDVGSVKFAVIWNIFKLLEME
jgi:hypothetical protein